VDVEQIKMQLEKNLSLGSEYDRTLAQQTLNKWKRDHIIF